MPTEPVKENLSQLNLLAKKLLKKAGEDPSPDSLYCLQLAMWGLESGNLESDQPGLRENLESLLYLQEPKKALKFLEGPDQHDLLRDLPKEERNNPLSLALVVLEQLHSRLSAELPGYPRPRDLPANFR
ncbi:MAG: hypothetical protein CVU57_20360 [Deltaproteobacteria bacterium HGW-Deltaproteobacteria-15]|jgi:hypothetical protein|nr:MAG: hypothetical protein CVU57_20360 [Deltaproteobacteria bacterium HGW-Deltaproteobacteria-15]